MHFLAEFLPRKHRKRHKCKPGDTAYRKQCPATPDRVDMTQRPMEANERLEPGHWAIDGLEGKQAYIYTTVERYSRLTLAALVPTKRSEVVVKAIEACPRMRPYLAPIRHPRQRLEMRPLFPVERNPGPEGLLRHPGIPLAARNQRKHPWQASKMLSQRYELLYPYAAR